MPPSANSPGARANSAHRSLMLKRTVTAVCLIALLIGLFALSYFVDHGNIFLDLFIWILLVGAVREMYFCMQEAGFKLFRVPLAIFLVTSYPVIYLMEHFTGQGFLGLVICFAAGVFAALVVFTFADPERNHAKDLFATVFVMVYPGFIISLAWMLMQRYSAVYAIPFAIFLPVGADTFAYWFGSMIGGKKLCPTISPKKTVAGFVGGLFGGMLVSVIMFLLFEQFTLFSRAGYVPFTDATWSSALIYLAIGLVGSLAGQLGDLAASRLKRALGIKDFGKIFPGHGGIMDRFDSIMAGIIVLLVSFTIIYGI